MKFKLLKKLVATTLAVSMGFTPLASLACTSFLLKGNDAGFVYGRSMEFGLALKSQLTVVPRNLAIQGVGVDGKSGSGHNWTSKYAVAGMNALDLPVLVDGMNEKGLVGGLLNAPNTAVYEDITPADSAKSISSIQILLYALTNFATVDEVKAGFPKIKVNRSTIPAYDNKSAPIRMTLHDAQGKSLVIEYLKGELVMTDNPVGVMTNDPPFREQLNNIGQYANLSNVEKNPIVINGATFSPPSSGSGLHGLPGDYLSTSRFIRALFLSKSAPTTNTTAQQTNTAWHILGSFDIPPGAISLPATNAYGGGAGGVEITEWSVVVDTKNLMYYVKMFNNTNVQAFDLKKIDFDAKELKYYSLDKPQTYMAIN
jgi:choloylglycine hydrolase